MKRKIIFCLISVITLISTGFKSDKTVISGDLKTGDNFEASLCITSNDFTSKVIATTKVVNGKFSFEIDPMSVPTMANIRFNHSTRRIILEKEDVTIKYSREAGYEIQGGFYNNLIFGWENSEEAKEINLQMYKQSVGVDFKSMSAEEKERYKSMSINLRDRQQQIRKNYLLSLYSHKDPYVRLFAVIESYNTSDKEIEILNSIKGELYDNADLQRLLKIRADADIRADIKKRLIIGADFIDINAVTISDKKVNLANTIKQNKFTLLEFWASWCHPCREEMKKLPGVYATYKEKGFEIFSFSVDSSRDDWLSASSEMDVKWINAYSDKSGVDHITDTYAIEAIPKNFLLDKDGKIVALNIRADHLKIFLEEKLK